MGCSPGEFIAAMRRFPASVSIIATRTPMGRAGMTVSSVTSLTADPPQLLVSLNRASGTTEAVRACGRFSVNVLREDQAELARRFASADPALRGEARFALGDWQESDEGVPYLADAAQSFLCRDGGQLETGTHVILIGGILRIMTSAADPVLIYHDGCYGHFSAACLGGAA